MSAETLFYILGIGLVLVALTVSAVGLWGQEQFPSTRVMRLTGLLFAGFVLATLTFAILNARDEQEERRAELAAESEQPSAEQPSAEQPAGGEAKAPAQPKAKGPGGTLTLAADKTQIAYDKKALSSKPGAVTIDFDNPSQVSHDVAIAQGSKEIAKSDLVAQGKASVTADLAPGSYSFFCTVPGH